ncbi:nuclear transport factor 2 family protein [Microbacterium candidum]|uniref:Nuclear transport factor 2 family protein n=1 Tax=Microbacterium candidum TaxID=3041922 RepID=A0ABT7MY20_9MICO|nr:nuclear transport factor 2 family protein [Microbacterium sp. ASV49]MDL9979348.1 nuclear transport factor 2 family protein [Microbacterium sp. ASV49]
MEADAARHRTLEERIAAIEDRLAIADLIARYGPAADSGSGEALAALWSDDGEYGFDDTVLRRDELPALVDIEEHRRLMAAGCAHVLSPPRIEIDGDVATAVNHSIVLEYDGTGWMPVRVGANRWELVRAVGGWRIRRRRNRLLTGEEAARALLAP